MGLRKSWSRRKLQSQEGREIGADDSCAEQGSRESDGVCLVLPFQGSLKHVSMDAESDPGGARGASLAAALSATEGGSGGGGWGWGSSGKYGRKHRRTGSLPSASAMQWALDIR